MARAAFTLHSTLYTLHSIADACEFGARTANECLFNYVSSSLFIATNAPHPFLFSFLRYDAGGWGDYANAAARKIGAVLFAGCVAGVEGEGKDVETECCAKSVTVEWVAD